MVTKEQFELLKKSITHAKDPNDLFTFDGVGCEDCGNTWEDRELPVLTALEALLKEREEIRKHIANVLPVLTSLTLGNHALKSTIDLYKYTVPIPDEENPQLEKSKVLYDKQQQLYKAIFDWDDDKSTSNYVLKYARQWFDAINEVEK